MLLLHYTGMESAELALGRLTDPASRVSAHWLIDEEGGVYSLVDEEKRAWHAGPSFWRGETVVNNRSIGVELVNPGHEFGYRPFPAAQMAALTELARAILNRHDIPARHVLGHSDVAPDRKQDPGELFDWSGLADRGIGLFPHINVDAQEIEETQEIARVQALLTEFGYAPADARGELDEASGTRILAFQRHFQPHVLTGIPDRQTLALLEALIEACA